MPNNAAMPSKLQVRLTRQLASKGVHDAKGTAIGLLTKRGDMKNGTLTTHGKSRQALGNAGRAKDRAAKAGGGAPGDYTYSAKTNRATKK